jgi:hypothetical protein
LPNEPEEQAMKDFLAFMNPTRWTILGLVVLGLLAALGAATNAVHSAGVDKGRAEVRAEWNTAREAAQTEQDQKTDAADVELIREVEVIRTVYQDRTEEVIKYVPAPATHCPADADFVRLFNGAAGS